MKTNKYKIITLCGSTKFKEDFERVCRELTLAGNIVLSLGVFSQCDGGIVLDSVQKEMLADMHKRKIDLCDEIFVINVRGYIGASTRDEIEYARHVGKSVRYLEEAVKYGNN